MFEKPRLQQEGKAGDENALIDERNRESRSVLRGLGLEQNARDDEAHAPNDRLGQHELLDGNPLRQAR